MSLTVELVTPTRTLVTSEADSVSAPTPQGEISVLPNHIPLLTALSSGELRIRQGMAVHTFVVSGGALVVRAGSRVSVLADAAEPAEEISEATAEEAYRRAQALRARSTVDDAAFAQTTAVLERELARVRVARKHRHRGHQGVARGQLLA